MALSPLYSSRLHLGLAKEATQGTPVAAAQWVPVHNNAKIEDETKWIDDKSLRGSPAMTFSTWAGPKSSAGQFDSEAYPIFLGELLMALLGVDTVTGSANPYSHAFTLNAGQPPSYTLSFYNGFNERAYPGSMLEELQLKYAMDGALEFSTKWLGWPSSVVTTTTPAVEGTAPFLAWQAALTLGGTANGHLIGMDLTGKRKAEVLTPANDSQVPGATFVGPLDITGKLTFAIADDTEITEMLNDTQPSVSILFSQGVSPAPTLTLQMSKCAFQKVAESFSKDYVAYDFDVLAVANSTDAGAGAPVSPLKATLVNSQTAGY